MTEDPTSQAAAPQTGHSTGIKVLLIVIGIVFLLPGACGGFFFLLAVSDWVGNLPDGTRDPYMPLVFVLGGGSFLFSMFLVDILLRFARWSAAPTLSLIVAITSAIVLILSAIATGQDFNRGSSEDNAIYMAMIFLGLVGAVLAPLQHWWSKRGMKERSDNEPS